MNIPDIRNKLNVLNINNDYNLKIILSEILDYLEDHENIIRREPDAY